jgi:hypothetical protein
MVATITESTVASRSPSTDCRFTPSKDTKAGDTNGQGVLNIWHVLSPAGEKITTPNPVSSHQPDASQTPGGIRDSQPRTDLGKIARKGQRAHKLHPVRRTTINLPSQPTGQRRRRLHSFHFDRC